ncbi:GNAT family N-acetyltransferase [Alteromonas facilis]|uniref:GNAT family N-acetyltransferase n=1 Tax=Alteromonas facilis TaxID=2048004 RepID=UPI000C291C0F|nr:GNAT family N-acetyltransferase [Alteromonas facilis]
MTIHYIPLTPAHFSAVIALGNEVQGDNYLDPVSLRAIYDKSWHNDINASLVAVASRDQITNNEYDPECMVEEGLLVGFRLTFAADQWVPDEWCSPALWPLPTEKVCYFKCNTVDSHYRGLGIGATLLKKSIEKAQEQGAEAGIAHIWLASPNNSAFGYFSACGGKLVKEHPNRWQRLALEDGYVCPVCTELCTCTAAEMILPFS